MTYSVLEIQTEVGRGVLPNSDRIIGLSDADSVSRKAFSWARVAALATTTASMATVTLAPNSALEVYGTRQYEKRIFNDTNVASGKLSPVEERLLALYNQSAKELDSINARVNQLTALVSLLSKQSSLDPAGSGTLSLYAELDIATTLDRACDAGFLEESILVLAETALASEDVFERLAGLRAIALSDPTRGRALLEERLQSESSEVIQSVLKSTLRAIA